MGMAMNSTSAGTAAGGRESVLARLAILPALLISTIGAHGRPVRHRCGQGWSKILELGVTMHGTRKDLVTVVNPWRGEIKVPSSISSLLELRLGEQGHDALGVVAHVPHYLSEAEYPDASLVLLRSLEAATGLELPAGPFPPRLTML